MKNEHVKTPKLGKKAEHKAKIAALKQKAIDAINEDIRFKAEQAGKIAQLERAYEALTKRVIALEQRPAQQGKQGEVGPRGKKGGFSLMGGGNEP